MEQTLQDYLGIEWPARSRKPRREGLTMVMDTGWPTAFCEGMLAQYGEYLDLVKLWDPHLRAPEQEIRRKIEVYGQIAQVYSEEVGDVDRAIDAYRNIVDLDQTNVPALDALSKLYEKQGDAAQAIDAWIIRSAA